MEDYKLVIIVRGDVQMSKGKVAAQAAHAAVESVLRSDDSRALEAWRDSGAKKVVLKAANLQELYQIKEAAKTQGLTSALITDAGRTEIAPGTVTCLGIGPAKETDIDKVSGNLKFL